MKNQEVIIYARSATENYSNCYQQIEKCLEFANKHRLIVSSIYKEYGIGLVINPLLNLAIEEIKQNPSRKLLVTDLSRLSRDLLLIAVIMQKIKSYGGTIITMS